ncbi:MAG TPA: sulfotransferase domain-containing protein [Bryobacteraceae bacterium]|nr:sulfotransferase domain-containing protein [Bryobacteraceae bacterium]
MANLKAGRREALDINGPLGLGPNLMARHSFDDVTMIASGLLTPEEIDRLRPPALDALAAEVGSRVYQKVHCGYTRAIDGQPLFAGRTARGAIYIVRDPRDVAVSLAHFSGVDIDRAIDSLNSTDSCLGQHTRRQGTQLRQQLLGWTGHVQSWLDQTDIPVHLIRFEDLKSDTTGEFRRALDFLGEQASGDQVIAAVEHSDIRELRAQEQRSGFRERWLPSVTFFRRGEAGSWRDELSPEQSMRIVEANAPMMQRLGYSV